MLWLRWCHGAFCSCTCLEEHLDVFLPVVLFVQRCTQLIANGEVDMLKDGLCGRIFDCGGSAYNAVAGE